MNEKNKLANKVAGHTMPKNFAEMVLDLELKIDAG